MNRLALSMLIVSAAIAGAAEISPALKSLQGKWNGERVNSDGRHGKATIEVKDDKMDYRAFNNDGELRFIAKGTLKVEKAGDIRALVITDIRGGRDQDNLSPVDDDR